MAGTVHAFEYLAAPANHKSVGVIATFGDEPFLKRLALKALRQQIIGDDADVPVATYDCADRVTDWRDVADELSTASLFGGGKPRLVTLERADSFVSANRQRLEDYVAKPRASGVLVLDVDEWPANTRLYKALDQSGLQIDCRPPQKKGKSKDIDEVAINRWIAAWAKSQHGIQVPLDAAQHLLDLTGPTFGLLDQNLAKLALLVPAGSKVTTDQVQEIVGGWRSKTTWDLVDAAASGETADALAQLDRLLHAGEHPLALVGSLSWSLRRYAAATRLFEQAERAGRKISLREALSQAGIRDWPLGNLASSEKRLIQLTRRRAGQLYRWLLDLDLSLKGTHSPDHRARWALEQLVLRMAKQPAKRGIAAPASK
ncbi:MAG: DNA polymerase III subunit delta [Planctomycetia bacterium]|nr:DNA polymerase III subunit delta [Planctomycetia bacterium]